MERVSKYATDPELLAVVERIERGEITKTEAAQALGINSATFAVRIKRGGFRERLRGIRDKSGDHLFKMEPGKEELYQEAIDRAMQAGRGGAAAALRAYPTLNRALFYRRLLAAKRAADPGYVPKKGPPRGPRTPAASLTLNPSVARP